MRKYPNVYFAGQMTGVEGYIESAASGYVAGFSAACRAAGKTASSFPETTMIGAMAHFVANGTTGEFVPMNANFGIVEALPERVKGGKVERYQVVATRALEELEGLMSQIR